MGKPGQMRHSGLKPNVVSYSAAVSVLEKGQQWQMALAELTSDGWKRGRGLDWWLLALGRVEPCSSCQCWVARPNSAKGTFGREGYNGVAHSSVWC